jgi:hypothetical protein
MKDFKILIACEYSGRVREAFIKKGFDAWSCDLLPTEIPGNHYQQDVWDVLFNNHFDMLIAFPPCTYLSSAGLHFCNIEVHGQKAIDRIKERNKAINFFLDLYSFPIEHICLENPLGHISSSILKPTQIIHPYYFGEKELKRTAVLLKNLPKLEYHLQNNLFGNKTASEYPEPYQIQIQKKTGKVKRRFFTDATNTQNFLNGHNKSKLFYSIAETMAEQWGQFIIDNYS